MPNMDKLLLLSDSNEDDINFMGDKKINEKVAVETEELLDIPKCTQLMLTSFMRWPIFMVLVGLMSSLLLIDVGSTVNPCDSRNPQAFQNFVTEWKQKIEAQEDLNQWQKWINVSDMPSETKEYFEQKIQVSTIQIETLNASLNPQFNHFQNCFLSNANSKLNLIFVYWISSYLIFSIGTIIIYFSVKHISKSYEANQNLYNEKAMKDIRGYERASKTLLHMCPLGSLLPCLFLYYSMTDMISTEFKI